jgi:hypothetical protein
MRTMKVRPELFQKRQHSRGQVIVLATILVFLFFLIAAVLIDVYHLEEARNWGYAVAQDAAMAGASYGRDWTGFDATLDPLIPSPTPREDKCVEPGKISLDVGKALTRAGEVCELERSARNILSANFYCEVRVIQGKNGGSVPNWPPHGRLGSMDPNWTTHGPAVGVYINFNVYTFFMSIVGRSSVNMNVFAASEVSQPAACPTMTPGG